MPSAPSPAAPSPRCCHAPFSSLPFATPLILPPLVLAHDSWACLGRSSLPAAPPRPFARASALCSSPRSPWLASSLHFSSTDLLSPYLPQVPVHLLEVAFASLLPHIVAEFTLIDSSASATTTSLLHAACHPADRMLFRAPVEVLIFPFLHLFVFTSLFRVTIVTLGRRRVLPRRTP
jgi:hypothetical protein